jgi:release factor glutamine methyltransferase
MVPVASAFLFVKLSYRDVGTGSDALPLPGFHLPNIHILATDISTTALGIACANALRQKVASRIHFLQTDLLSSFPEQPVFRNSLTALYPRRSSCLPVYRREPALPRRWSDGLKRSITGRYCLAPAGRLLEIESSQGQAVSTLAQDIYPSATVHLLRDLEDRDRLVSIQLYEQ